MSSNIRIFSNRINEGTTLQGQKATNTIWLSASIMLKMTFYIQKDEISTKYLDNISLSQNVNIFHLIILFHRVYQISIRSLLQYNYE